MTRRTPLLLLVAIACLALLPALAGAEDRTINFAEGQWDAAQWTPLKLPMQAEMMTFTQRPDCLGNDAFTQEQIKAGLDNILLMTDTGTDEGQFEVLFHIGPEKGTAPGVFLSPVLDGDALVGGIAVFIADYTMAVWNVTTDAEGVTQYEHLVRLARWQDPEADHIVRCRYSNRRKMIALQVDDSDVLILRLPELEINSKVGIWGCHGTCDFYTMTIRDEGTLPWSGSPPAEGG